MNLISLETQFKKLVQRLANRAGYQILKLNKEDDLDQYISLYGVDAVQERRFYNIGAGGFYHPAWTNVDKLSDWYLDSLAPGTYIDWDLLDMTALPLQSNSALVVYSSHTIEHITDEAAQNMFNEVYRVLRINGFFRVITPDIDLEYRAYKDGDRDYFYWIKHPISKECRERKKVSMPLSEASTQQNFLSHFAASVSILHSDGASERISDEELDALFSKLTYEDALNYCTSKCPIEIQRKYPGNHINWWNEAKSRRMLEQAGFNKVHRSGYGQSYCPILRNTSLFDNTHPKMSLYMEAIK